MKLVLDTSLLIEYLRGEPEALGWFEARKQDRAAVPSLALMEVYQGCHSRKELLAAQKTLGAFTAAHVAREDSILALQLHKTHCLSSGMSIPDAIIAAMTINRDAILITFNTKDFARVAGLNCETPYG